MNDKKAKKLRQLMRREYAKDIFDITKANNQFIKPKPKYIPMFVYIRLLKLFIHIK